MKDSLHFFNTTYQHFLNIASKQPIIDRYFQIAGQVICLRFATPKMIEMLTLALLHLEVEEPLQVDLTICIWDSLSTHASTIVFPWKKNQICFRGEVVGYNCKRIHTVLDIHTKALHLWDSQRNLALYWIENAEKLHWWVRGSPLQLILHWWMQNNGHQLTHAAAIGYQDRGLLLAGKSGSGKSTMTLACMKAGMHYVSEDYCMIANHKAFAVYNSAKLEENTLKMFPELACQVTGSIDGKSFLFHHLFQPQKMLPETPLKAIIVLQREGNVPGLAPITEMDAIGPLALSTMWQLTHTGPSVFQFFKRFINTLPCFRLTLGSSLEKNVDALKELL